jgi:hypothetical protein
LGGEEVSGSEFRVSGSDVEVQSSKFKVQGSVSGSSAFRVPRLLVQQAAAQLQHPNIVAIHEVDEWGQHFYSIDFVAGQTVSQVAGGFSLEETGVNSCSLLCNERPLTRTH